MEANMSWLILTWLLFLESRFMAESNNFHKTEVETADSEIKWWRGSIPIILKILHTAVACQLETSYFKIPDS